MKNLKESVRYLLAQQFQGTGPKNFFRTFYLRFAEVSIRTLKRDFISGAWVRRSAVTEDFTPFLSDIDLTVVIKQNKLSEFLEHSDGKTPFFLKDLQIIPSGVFEAWKETGGFRNRQVLTWKSLIQTNLKLAPPEVRAIEFEAFQLGYECHLLYKQLLPMLKRFHFQRDMYNEHGLHKIFLEISRLQKFWKEKDVGIPLLPRKALTLQGTDLDLIKELDQFCEELLGSLNPVLRRYSWHKSETFRDDLGIGLALEVEGQRVFIVHSPSLYPRALIEKADWFVTTKSYLCLVKGIGIQEQDDLNELAGNDPGGFYYRFCCQRLALDLLGAMYLNSNNSIQLYYCFENIQRFHRAVFNSDTPHWDEISEFWKSEKRLPYEGAQLRNVAVAQLDILSAML